MAKNFRVKKQLPKLPDPNGYAPVAPVPVSVEAKPQGRFHCRRAGYLMDVAAYCPEPFTGAVVLAKRAPSGVELVQRFPVDRANTLAMLEALDVDKGDVVTVRVECEDASAEAVVGAYFLPDYAEKVKAHGATDAGV